MLPSAEDPAVLRLRHLARRAKALASPTTPIVRARTRIGKVVDPACSGTSTPEAWTVLNGWTREMGLSRVSDGTWLAADDLANFEIIPFQPNPADVDSRSVMSLDLTIDIAPPCVARRMAVDASD